MIRRSKHLLSRGEASITQEIQAEEGALHYRILRLTWKSQTISKKMLVTSDKKVLPGLRAKIEDNILAIKLDKSTTKLNLKLWQRLSKKNSLVYGAKSSIRHYSDPFFRSYQAPTSRTNTFGAGWSLTSRIEEGQ